MRLITPSGVKEQNEGKTMSDSNTFNFDVGKRYSQLIQEELKKGNFRTKSEFLRLAVREWFKNNRNVII